MSKSKSTRWPKCPLGRCRVLEARGADRLVVGGEAGARRGGRPDPQDGEGGVQQGPCKILRALISALK